MGSEFVGQIHGHVFQGGLGRAEQPVSGQHTQGVNARDGHDPGRPTAHQRHGLLDRQQRAADRQPERPHHIVFFLLEQGSKGRGGGADDQDVEMPIALLDLSEHGPHGLAVAHVGLHRQCL